MEGIKMSVETVKMFLKKVNNDEQLQKRISGMEADSWENMLVGLTRLGEEAGLPFRADDFLRFQEELFANFNRNGELDDEQLDLVAGGTGSISQDEIDGHSYILQAAVRLGFAPFKG